MKKEKGILLLALGHHNYGKMAAVLAASLLVADRSTQIHLAYTESAIESLTDKEKELFSSSSVIDEKYYTNKGKREWIRAKMYLYQLTPFKETVFLDSDIIWLQKSPNDLFTQFEALDLTFSNSGFGKSSAWADIDQVKKAFEIKEIIDLQSEFIYFKKNDTAKNYFTTAQKIYNGIKTQTKTINEEGFDKTITFFVHNEVEVKNSVFAGAVPDELPYTIAAAVLDIKPHAMPYHPIFWKPTQKRTMHGYVIAKHFYGLSLGGNQNEKSEIDTYNILAKAAYIALGLPFPYQWIQKRNFLAERQKF